MEPEPVVVYITTPTQEVAKLLRRRWVQRGLAAKGHQRIRKQPLFSERGCFLIIIRFLLVAQRLNGLEICGTVGWIESKKQTDGG